MSLVSRPSKEKLSNHKIGRGTSPEDGLAISLAICEELLQSEAVVLFATHFHQVTDMLQDRIGVGVVHLDVQHDEARNAMMMSFKIATGMQKIHQYGIKIASTTSLPSSITRRACETSSRLREDISERNRQSPAGITAARRKGLLELVEILSQIDERRDQLDDVAIRSWLESMSKRFMTL